jgi:hypothetical protein
MEGKSINPVRRAYRRYFWEFGSAMILYVAMMWVRNWLLFGARPGASGPMEHAPQGWQIVVAAMPVIPVALVLVAIVRLVRNIDEMQRRVYVESAAIAGAATALLAATYGLIEGDFFPKLSAWWTYSVFMFGWLIASGFLCRSYYR